MTSQTDLDRLLADWLDEGPRKAPEHILEAGRDHARSHPRRPDPFRPFRRDVMPHPAGLARVGVALQPVWAVLLVALLVAAVGGVALVGSFGNQPVVVPPSPSPSPSVSPSPSPAPTPIVVDLQELSGADATLVIEDTSGSLVGAVSGVPRDGGSVPDRRILFEQVGPTSIRLTWTLGTCETVHTLRIDEARRAFSMDVAACEGDSFPRDLTVILDFDAPIDAQDLSGSVAEAGASPSAG